MQLRCSCVAAIYDKSLKLSSTHQETNASSGTIMNLASNDVERFLLAALFISHLIWSPVQAICILFVGWIQMGPSFAIGFCLLIFGFVPAQFYLSNKFAFLRSKIAGITDQRVQFVSQAVQGARVMKMSGYEDRFLDRIADGRQREISQISKANRLKALNEAMFFACNVVVSLVIFLVHVGWFGGVLTPGNVYTVFTLVNILQLELTKHVSLGVMGVSEVYVSISRIQRFLEFPEKPVSLPTEEGFSEKPDSKENTEIDETSSTAISLQNVDCYWNFVQELPGTTSSDSPTIIAKPPSTESCNSADVSKSETDDSASRATSEAGLTLALSNISLDLEAGQLTCVIGTVGSGKSALLQAVVGELPVLSGNISRRTKDKNETQQKRGTSALSYASQDPWIMNGTIRENVTMGLDFEQEWYDQVIDACGLRMDLKIFHNGDETLVGDRGVQCSGGQRARIGLARAVYRDADVLIVDDPLSAVDARVGKQIFHEALLGLGVKRGKCVLLATHQHQYVHDHRCVLLVGGCIKCIGSYSECVDAAGGKLKLHMAADDGSSIEEAIENESNTAESSKPDSTSSTSNKSGAEVENDEGKELKKELDEKNESKERSDKGVVKWETYKNYVRAMGGWGVAFFVFLTFCVTQGVALWTIITMGRWAELTPQEQGSWNILGLIMSQVGLAIFLATFRALLSFGMTIKASKNLHDEMAKAVLRAKISFFDTNP